MTAIFIVFVSVFLFQSHLVLSAQEKNDCPIVSDVAEKSAKNASVVVEVPFPAEDDGKIKGLKEFHRTDYPTMSLMPDEKENAEQKSLYRPEFK